MEWKESGLALERVSKLKEEAKLLWSQYSEESTEHIKQAIDKYEEALETLYSSTTALEEKSCMEVRISLHCNLAICYNRISKPYMAYFHSNAALQMKPTETKALLQRAKAYLQLGDLFSAFGDVQQLEASGKGHDMATIRLKTQIEKAIDEQSQKNDKEVVENFQIRLHTRSFFIPSDSDTAAD